MPANQLHRVAARPDSPPENPLVRGAAKTAEPLLRTLGFSPRRFARGFVPRDSDEVVLSDEFLLAEVPSINGVYTARSLARFYAALGSDDGLDGVRIWSPETRLRAMNTQFTEMQVSVDTRFTEMQVSVDSRFDVLDRSFSDMSRRVADLRLRIERVDSRLVGIEGHLRGVELELRAHNERLGEILDRIHAVE